MARSLRVLVTRTFNSYPVGRDMTLDEDDEVKALIKSGLLQILAVEIDDAPAKPKAEKRVSGGKVKRDVKSKVAATEGGQGGL